MLAADKLLLTSTIRKNATELKGKELALHKALRNSRARLGVYTCFVQGNFDAVGTQAAVLAGFAVTRKLAGQLQSIAQVGCGPLRVNCSGGKRSAAANQGCNGSRVPHAGDGALCPARGLLRFCSHYAAWTSRGVVCPKQGMAGARQLLRVQLV